MKNCHSATSAKTVQDDRLFSDICAEELEYDEMPSRRRRRRSNHQTTEDKPLDCPKLPVTSLNSAMITTEQPRYSSSTRSPSHLTRNYITTRMASHAAQRVMKPTVVNQMLRHRPAGGLLVCLLIALISTPCLLVKHISALESGGGSHETGHTTSSKSPVSSSEQVNAKPVELVDNLAKKDSASSEKSIVASLSSAVATAAAAAAVAAAQNSLSSNDGRSLSAGHHHHHGQAQRSPGVNLAIKLVDTIPEVPYNILHNMKKLDHAAPFYNVPNKMSGGSTKESTSNFLTTALAATSSGNLAGAAEQLSSLFKSPLWKRIADGYGDFASEFRSLFRPPGGQPMKGSTSSTSKLIRDISVPALLMLLASSISGEWRPVRTRRKSFRPVDIPSALDTQNVVGHQVDTPSFLVGDMKQQATSPQSYPSYERPQHSDQTFLSSAPQAAVAAAPNNFASSQSEWLEQIGAARQALNQQQQQQQQQLPPQQVGPLVRINGDNNLQHLAGPAIDSAASNWISSMQAPSISQDQQPNFDSQQSATYERQLAPRQTVARRSDELIAASSPSKPSANSASKPFGAMNLAALATVGAQGGKLINKLLSAGDDGNSYRMVGLVSGRNGERVSSIKRDQLSDKQRYSLVGSDESPTKQPHPLSAMAHAVASRWHPPSVGGKSGSASAAAATATAGSAFSSAAPAKVIPGFLSRASLQNLIVGDKTINHQEDSVFMRRQPQASSGPAEQRDLTKLLPEAWREVVKRTMTTVQQQANVQWKSIEGQLTNWVQDKLKTVAASASPSTSSGAGSAGGAPSGSVSAPIGNMLASMSSTALNIFGLNKNNSSSPSSAATSAATTATTAQVSQAKSQSAGDESAATANQRGKIDQTKATQANPLQQPQPAKGALAGVASMIVNVIADRTNASKQPSSPPASSPPQKYPNTQRTTDHTNDKPTKSQTLGDLAASVLANSSVSSIASKYPTLTGAQQSGLPDKLPAVPSSSGLTPGTHSSSSMPTAQPTTATAKAPESSTSAAAHPLD